MSDSTIPTGSLLKYFEIQHSVVNVVSAITSMVVSIQLVHAGQSAIDPRVAGGNPQRNQVFFIKSFMAGENQQNDLVLKFKVPPKFQRVREGDVWTYTYINDVAISDQVLIIYKFYQ